MLCFLGHRCFYSFDDKAPSTCQGHNCFLFGLFFFFLTLMKYIPDFFNGLFFWKRYNCVDNHASQGQFLRVIWEVDFPGCSPWFSNKTVFYSYYRSFFLFFFKWLFIDSFHWQFPGLGPFQPRVKPALEGVGAGPFQSFETKIQTPRRAPGLVGCLCVLWEKGYIWGNGINQSETSSFPSGLLSAFNKLKCILSLHWWLRW